MKVAGQFRRLTPGSRAAMGERLGGYIYGTIVVLATTIAGAKVYEHGPGHVAALLLMTTGVFWLAHVYAHALAESVAKDEHISGAGLLRIAHRESSIIEAAILPALALLLGHWGVFTEKTAVWVAIGCGLGVLVAEGFAFARAGRLGALGTVTIVAVNIGLGLALVGLKLFVSHH